MFKYLKSKTILVNLIASLIASLGIFDKELLNALGIINTTKFLAIIGAITTILNIFLRALKFKENEQNSTEQKN